MFREHFFDCSVSSSLFYLYITSLVRLGVEPLGFNKFFLFFIFVFRFSATVQHSSAVMSLLSVLAEADKVWVGVLANHEKGFAKKNYISSVNIKVAWFLKTFCAVVVIFEMSRKAKTFVKIANNGFFWNILFVLVKHWYITLNDVIWRKATAVHTGGTS